MIVLYVCKNKTIMKLKQRLLNTIKSVLVIHESQKNKTDIHAAEKCEEIVEDIAVQFAIYRNGVMDSEGKDIVQKELLENRVPEKALFQHFKKIKGL